MFYMGYDYNDPILATAAGRESFRKYFHFVTTHECREDLKPNIKFVWCNYSAKIAWSQNDALLAGYNDGMDYLYMVNDDTIMVTGDWTNAFVQQLAQFHPFNVGVVGPRHSGGNLDILTYHLTHRTHVDIFGFFYPRIFTDWFADEWITLNYEPNNSKKMSNILLNHTLEKGTRYEIHSELGMQMKGALANASRTLRGYLESRGVDWETWHRKATVSTTNNPEGE